MSRSLLDSVHVGSRWAMGPRLELHGIPPDLKPLGAWRHRDVSHLPCHRAPAASIWKTLCCSSVLRLHDRRKMTLSTAAHTASAMYAMSTSTMSASDRGGDRMKRYTSRHTRKITIPTRFRVSTSAIVLSSCCSRCHVC